MSLCAQHSSRPVYGLIIPYFNFFFLFSSILFLVLFSKCTANHPPLTYFAVALTEFQDHTGSPGDSARLFYYCRSLKLPCSLCQSVTYQMYLKKNFLICNFSHSHQRANRRPRKGSATAVATDRSRHDRAALAISTQNHLLVCVYARFFGSLKKKKEQSHTSRCA